MDFVSIFRLNDLIMPTDNDSVSKDINHAKVNDNNSLYYLILNWSQIEH